MTRGLGRFQVVLTLLIAVSGCAKSMPVPALQPNSRQSAVDSRIVQRDLMGFTDRFGAAIIEEYDRAAAKTTDPKVKLQWAGRKTSVTTGLLTNAVNSSPIVGLMDTAVMVTLLRQNAEDPALAGKFGGQPPEVVATLKLYEDTVWQMLSRFLSESQINELRQIIDRWRKEHPQQRYVTMVRLSDFMDNPTLGGAARNRGAGSVLGLMFLDPLSGLDPAVREVERSREAAERMFYYVQRMPLIVSWQAQLFCLQMLAEPQIDQTLKSTSTFADSTTRFVDVTQQMADALGKWPEVLGHEREQWMKQLSETTTAQIKASITELSKAVDESRNQMIEQAAKSVAAEREAAINQADRAVAAQRDAAIAQIDQAASKQRAGLLADMEAAGDRLADRLFWKQIIVVGAGVCMVMVAVILLRAIQPGSRRASRDTCDIDLRN